MRKAAFTGFGVSLLFILAFAIVFFLNFKTVIVSGPSMEPTFFNADRLLASKAYWLVGNIRKKDIIVLHSEDGKGYLIKRVAYLPGEVVDFWNVPDTWDLRDGDYIVPKDCYFVLGDNYYVSEDSRKYGPIKKDQVLGKIVLLPRPWIMRLSIGVGILGLLVVVIYARSYFRSRRRAAS